MQMHEAFVKLGPGDKLFGKGFAMAVFFDEGFCEKDVDVEIRVQLPEDFHPNCDQIEKVRFVTIPSVSGEKDCCDRYTLRKHGRRPA